MAARRSGRRRETGRAGEMRRRRRPVDEVPSEQTPEPPPPPAAPEDDAHARDPSTGGSAVGNKAGRTRKSKAAVGARRTLRARARCQGPPRREGTQIRTSSPEDDATPLRADGLRATNTGTADSVQTQMLPGADIRSEQSSAAAMEAPDSRQRKAALPLPRKRRRLADNDLRDASGTNPTEHKRGARGTADHQRPAGPRDVVADRQGGSAGPSGTAALSPGRTAPAHWRRLLPRKTPATPAGGLRYAPPLYSGLPIVPTLVPVKVFLASSGFAAPRPPSLPHEHPHSDIAIAAKPDEDGDTALHIAVVQRNVQMVNKIVQLFHMGRISLDVYNHLHQSPLHLAIITGQEALVAVLLSGGASPAALDRHGMNAVHLACSAGQTDVLALLLAQPACRALLNSHDFAGMTPLHVAVKGSCVSAVSRLLENQVNVDALDWKNGASALIYAVENDNKEIVELLIKNGANVNQQTYGGNAAVHVASGRGLLEITCLLVRHGANVGLKNTQNDNAYTVTTNQQVIDILKGRNAKLHVTGSDKCSLHSQHGGNSPNKPRDLPKGPATTSMLINRASQTDEPTMSVPSSPRQNSPVQNTRQPVDGSKQGEETSASNTEGSVTGAPSTGEATKSIGQGRIIMKRATAKTTRPCVVVSSSADSRDEVKVKLQAAIRSRVATATFKTTPGTLSQRAQVPSIVTLHPVTPVIKIVTTSSSTASKAANASHTLTKTTPSVKESYISFAKEWLSTAKVTPPPKCITTSVITKRFELETKQSSKDPCTLQLEPTQSSKDPCTLQLEPTQSSKDTCTLQREATQSSKDPCTLQLEPKQSSKDLCTLQLESTQSSEDTCTLQLEPTQSSKDPCTLQLEPKQRSEDPCTLQLEPTQSSEDPCTLQLEPTQSSKDPCTLQLEPTQSSEDPCTLQLEPTQSSKDPCTLQLEPKQRSEDPCTLQLEPTQSSKDPCTLQLEPTQSSKDLCTLQLEPKQSSKDPCTLQLEPKQSSKDPCTLQLEPTQSSKDPCTLQLEPKQSSKDPCTLQLEPTQSSEDPCTLQLEPKQSSKDPCTLQLEPKQRSEDPCTLQLEPTQSSKDPCTLQLEHTQSSEDPCKLEPKQSSKEPRKSIISKDVVTTQAS